MIIQIKKDPRYPIDLKNIRSRTKELLLKNNFTDLTELSLFFIGVRKAKQLNMDYRKMDYVPEVLAFPMKESGPDGIFRLGDITICFPLARKQAARRSRMVEEVIVDLIEHGIKNLIQ